MAPYKRILGKKVFNNLLNIMASYLSKRLEKRRGYARRISELGTIGLESDISGVVDVVVRAGCMEFRMCLLVSADLSGGQYGGT